MIPQSAFPALFVLLWATGFIGARYAMPHAEPFFFLMIRFAIAGAGLLAFVLVSGRKLPTRTQALNAMFAGALIHGFYLAGVFWAIRNGMPAGMSALIVGLQPIMTTLLANAVLEERTTPQLWAGLGIGLIGVTLVLWPKLSVGGTGITPVTIAVSFFAVLAISSGTVWQKRMDTGSDLVAGTALQYAGATLLTGALTFAFEAQKFEATGELMFALAWLVIVLSIGAVFLLLILIREGAVNKVASLFYLVPAVTALMAFILFGEELHGIQIVGMAVVAAAVWIATTQRLTSLRRDSA